MKVLITGGAGFIGSHIADAFAKVGHDVLIYDLLRPYHTPGMDYIVGDLMETERLEAAVADCDLTVHSGGLLGTHETVTNVQDAVKINIGGTVNVLEATARLGRRLINVSKPNVWLNPYSITKDCSEKFCFMYVDEFDAQVATVKLYNVYGPRQKYNYVRKAIPTWIVDSLNGKPIEIFGSGTATVDLVHAGDVGRGILAIAENFELCRLNRTVEQAADVWNRFPKHNEQILELGSGRSITVNECVEWIGRALNRDIYVRHIPMRRGEIDGTELCANVERMTALTGFVADTDLLGGLRETVAYYREKLSEVAGGIL